MFEKTIFILAAFATIAQFLLEAWRSWKKYRTDSTHTDGGGRKDEGQR